MLLLLLHDNADCPGTCAGPEYNSTMAVVDKLIPVLLADFADEAGQVKFHPGKMRGLSV